MKAVGNGGINARWPVAFAFDRSKC